MLHVHCASDTRWSCTIFASYGALDRRTVLYVSTSYLLACRDPCCNIKPHVKAGRVACAYGFNVIKVVLRWYC